MLGCIREVAIITMAEDQAQFQRLSGDGAQWGISLTYIIQPSPDGLAQAYLLARDFLSGAPSVLVLGYSKFFGHGLPEMLAKVVVKAQGGTVFGYRVSNPESYGVVDFDADGQVRAVIEKPVNPPSNYADTGLYYLESRAAELAALVKPSPRGELEIVDLLEIYRAEGSLNVERMGRGFAWLDTGIHGSFLDAGNFVRTLENRQGMQVGCPEEIAYRHGWISRDVFAAIVVERA